MVAPNSPSSRIVATRACGYSSPCSSSEATGITSRSNVSAISQVPFNESTKSGGPGAPMARDYQNESAGCQQDRRGVRNLGRRIGGPLTGLAKRHKPVHSDETLAVSEVWGGAWAVATALELAGARRCARRVSNAINADSSVKKSTMERDST